MNKISQSLSSFFLKARRSEMTTTLLMFGYFFLVLAEYMMGKAVRDALFISSYGALNLPWVIITQAVFLTLLIGLYIRLSNRLSHYRLSALTLLFFAVTGLLAWALNPAADRRIIFVIYIWVGIVGAIAPMQVWTMANLIYHAREAKRLFGVIGSGGILGSICGGYLTRKLAPVLGTENLMLVVVAFLLISVALVHLIWRRSRQRTALVAAADAAQRRKKETPRTIWQSAALIGRSRYLSLIAALVGLSAMATTFAYVQFSELSQAGIADKDSLAAFFGGLSEGLSWVAFLLQFLLTGRLVHRWGLDKTIYILPISLLSGSLVAWFFPSLWAAALLRGSDQIFRHSIDRSTTEMLYLPLAHDLKVPVKSFIDTVAWRLGDGLAALLILVISTNFPGLLNAASLSLANLCLILPWLVVCWLVSREYIRALADSIKRQNVPKDDISSVLIHSEVISHGTGRLVRQKRVYDWMQRLEDDGTRMRALRELNRLRLKDETLDFVPEKIGEVLQNEIQTYQQLSGQQPRVDQATIAAALNAQAADTESRETRESLERMFRLLGLLYPPADIYFAYHAITGGSLHLKSNALEYLDQVLHPELRESLLPAIEADDKQS
jgi:AAA family ATP:ADP antiporter